MPIAHDFVDHWFRHHALSRATPTTTRLAQEWLEQASVAYDGFALCLREVALAALADADLGIVRRAIIALATVGTAADLPQLEALAEGAPEGVSAEARATIYELQRRAG